MGELATKVRTKLMKIKFPIALFSTQAQNLTKLKEITIK